MKGDKVSKLQQENDRLKYLVTHDELTGILNRRAVEEQIKEFMPNGGILLVCDLDGFKKINDRFGHLIGDKYIKETAKLLKFLLRPGDLLGRIGGDEFVIFSVGNSCEDRILSLKSKIENRFQSYQENENVPLGISVGAAACLPGDTYESMFQRADQELLLLKDTKHKQQGTTTSSPDNWILDMNTVHQELTEQVKRPGAKCQDFESFKTICRFIERCIGRDGRKACVVLMSLVDTDGNARVPFDIWQQMELLGEILQQTLRMGDVFTRYSSCQYLILLIDVDKERADLVEARIERLFRESSAEERLIFHYCYELQKVEILEK